MKNSKESLEKQKTPQGGWTVEVGLETQGKQGARQAEAALEKGNDDVQQCTRKKAGDPKGRFREAKMLMMYTSELLEMVLERGNLKRAYEQVVRNKGSHGIDGMTVDRLKSHLQDNWEQIKSQLITGTYKPLPVRRVEIPKPDGGIRLLGIPRCKTA